MGPFNVNIVQFYTQECILAVVSTEYLFCAKDHFIFLTFFFSNFFLLVQNFKQFLVYKTLLDKLKNTTHFQRIIQDGFIRFKEIPNVIPLSCSIFDNGQR